MPGSGRRALPRDASISAHRIDGENRSRQNGGDFTENLEKNVQYGQGSGTSIATYGSRKRFGSAGSRRSMSYCPRSSPLGVGEASSLCTFQSRANRGDLLTSEGIASSACAYLNAYYCRLQFPKGAC